MSRKIRHENVPTEFHADSQAEALFLEQAQAYFRDLQNIANNAPDGQVINLTEGAAVQNGRELVRKSLEITFQERIDHLEKKKKRRSAKNAKRKKGTEDSKTKTS